MKTSGRQHFSFIPKLLLFVPLLFLICGILIPVFALVQQSLQDNSGVFTGIKNFAAILTIPAFKNAVLHSLFVSTIVTLIVVPLAFVLAYGFTHTQIWGKKICQPVFILPLCVPSLFPALGLIYLFGQQGILRFLLPELELYGVAGIILASIFFCLPPAFLLLYTVLRSIDPHLYEAAHILGASSLKKLTTITIPHARYGLVSTITSVFILCLTDFGVPKLLGGNYSMLSTEIFKQVIGQQNFGLGASLCILLLIPAIFVFIIDSYTRPKQQTSLQTKLMLNTRSSKITLLVYSLFCWACALCILGVLGIVIWSSFIEYWPYNLSFSLTHYNFEKTGLGLEPLFNSLLIAGLCASIGSILVFTPSWVAQRINKTSCFSKLFTFLALLPLSIPGLALGLGWVFAFNTVLGKLSLTNSVVILACNTLVHLYTIPYLVSINTLHQLDSNYEKAGQSLGIAPIKTFTKVIVPLSKLTILDCMFYLFINAMTTISALVFLYEPHSLPASIAIIHLSDIGSFQAASAMGTLLFLCCFTAYCIRQFLLYCLRKKRYR